MIFGDYHTHSIYSGDGKSTISQNVAQANILGLKQLGVSEHCYGHKNGIKPGDFESIKKEISNQQILSKTKILFSMEMNLLDEQGHVDLTFDEQKKLDYIILGFHKSFRRYKGMISHIKMLFKNKKQIERNTDAYINAIQNNRVNILAHLNYGCRVNVIRLAKIAVEKNIFIELNGKRILFSSSEMKEMIKMGVKFIINSDSHFHNNICENHLGVNVMLKYNIPENQVVNYNKVPVFKG